MSARGGSRHILYSVLNYRRQGKGRPRLFGGQNPCRASCFATQMVELNQSIRNKRLNTAGLYLVELNRLFQIDGAAYRTQIHNNFPTCRFSVTRLDSLIKNYFIIWRNKQLFSFCYTVLCVTQLSSEHHSDQWGQIFRETNPGLFTRGKIAYIAQGQHTVISPGLVKK